MAETLGLTEEEYVALLAPNDRWPFRSEDDGACGAASLAPRGFRCMRVRATEYC
jgi:hypothetical protein